MVRDLEYALDFAFHEAGHAIAASFLGIDLEGVEVTPRDSYSGGRVRFSDEATLKLKLACKPPRREADRAFVGKFIVVALAGGAAQVKSMEQRGDWVVADGADGDLMKAVEVAEEFTGDRDTAVKLVSSLVPQAEQLVAELWPSICRLANALASPASLFGSAGMTGREISQFLYS